MPNRIVKEDLLTDEALDVLDYPEEVFFRRLWSVADDHGRFHANAQILRATCYPLRTDRVRVADISRWIAACVKTGRVVLYQAAGGKEFIQIRDFGQQIRAKSKFPDPGLLSSDSNCKQVIAIDSLTCATNTNTNTSPTSEREKGVGKGSQDGVYARMLKPLATAYRRDADFGWTYAEQSSLVEISKRPKAESELVEILAYKEREEPRFFPQSLERLLQNWTATLDKSRRPADQNNEPMPLDKKDAISRLAAARKMFGGSNAQR